GRAVCSPAVRFSMTPKDEHDMSRDRVVAALADSTQLGEEQLRLILDALPAPIAYLDADERYRFDNKSHERWFGRPRAELYGRSLREVFGEEQYAELRPFVERALAGHQTTFEKEVDYPDGSRRSINVTCVPEADEEGRVRGFVAIITDMTKRTPPPPPAPPPPPPPPPEYDTLL